jgi:hypothetical protein
MITQCSSTRGVAGHEDVPWPYKGPKEGSSCSVADLPQQNNESGLVTTTAIRCWWKPPSACMLSKHRAWDVHDPNDDFCRPSKDADDAFVRAARGIENRPIIDLMTNKISLPPLISTNAKSKRIYVHSSSSIPFASVSFRCGPLTLRLCGRIGRETHAELKCTSTYSCVYRHAHHLVVPI